MGKIPTVIEVWFSSKFFIHGTTKYYVRIIRQPKKVCVCFVLKREVMRTQLSPPNTWGRHGGKEIRIYNQVFETRRAIFNCMKNKLVKKMGVVQLHLQKIVWRPHSATSLHPPKIVKEQVFNKNINVEVQ